ncbi:MAG: DUF5799 family protein [Halococcoides sp.]
MTDWRDTIAAERMALDGEFADRVADAGLTSRQWDLVMSAVELRIDRPDSPAEAELRADTGALDAILDDLVAMDDAGDVGLADHGDDGGFLDWLGSLTGSERAEMRTTAAGLAEAYVQRLETRLRESGQWATVCERAARNTSD